MRSELFCLFVVWVVVVVVAKHLIYSELLKLPLIQTFAYLVSLECLNGVCNKDLIRQLFRTRDEELTHSVGKWRWRSLMDRQMVLDVTD